MADKDLTLIPEQDKRMDDLQALTEAKADDTVRPVVLEYLQLQKDGRTYLVAFELQNVVLSTKTDAEILEQFYKFGRQHLTNVKWQKLRFKNTKDMYAPEVEPVLEA